MRSYKQLLVFCMVISALLIGGCGDEEATLEYVFLNIKSEVPGERPAVRKLVIQFRKVGSNGKPVLFKDVEFAKHRYEKVLPSAIVLHESPYVVSIAQGAVIQGLAWIHVQGLSSDGTVVATWAQKQDLASNVEVNVQLTYLDSNCDADGDGMKNCQISGCCASGEQEIGDCDDGSSVVHPLVELPQCIPCGLAADLNCDGVPDPCPDADGDNHADCDEKADCDPANGEIYAGAEEICNEVDDNCNGKIDEGLTNTCMDYKICKQFQSCDQCQSAPEEICDDEIDNDCDGKVDLEQAVCATKWEGDYDGDGFVGDQDCAKYDAKVFSGSTFQGCCFQSDVDKLTEAERIERCDFDCDGTLSICDPDDLDGDLYTGGADCKEGDPTINKNAPEHCNDNVDQDCIGGVDNCEGIDNDKDGFVAPWDCNDADPDVNPWALEKCNGVDDDCNGFIDDGNPGGGEKCFNPKTSSGKCSLAENMGTKVCTHNLQSAPSFIKEQPGVDGNDVAVVCVDFFIPPDKEELCDKQDDDCDGTADEDFSLCDLSPAHETGGCADNLRLAHGSSCGKGECGVGTVACAAFNPEVPAALVQDQVVCTSWAKWADEAKSGCADAGKCCDGKDNDCDGKVDGHTSQDPLMTTCKVKGVCGQALDKIGATCVDGSWQCDYTDVPFYEGKKTVTDTALDEEVTCEGKDNDCDGTADEDLKWNSIAYGAACDGVGECGVGVVECAGDQSGLATCSSNPNGSEPDNKPELCNGKDDDCDGVDDNAPALKASDCAEYKNGVCTSSKAVPSCVNGQTVCDYSNVSNYEPEETSCDGLDNDCNGSADKNLKWNNQQFGSACDGTGECGKGIVECDLKTKTTTCSTNANGSKSQVQAEVCDGKDNNCNGANDDGLTYENAPINSPCNGIGACGTGTVVCSTDGKKTATCSTNPNYQSSQASQELCDKIDNDCDGATDEDLGPETPGATCKFKGVCNKDNVIALCVQGTWLCDYKNVSGYEDKETLCDGLDNDCDGQIDEAGVLPNIECDQDGVCKGTQPVCKGKSNWQCFYPQKASETCDGKDNDCDGITDEGFTSGSQGKGKKCFAGNGTCIDQGKYVCSSDGKKTVCDAVGKSAGTSCNDSNTCTHTDVCTGGKNSSCSGTAYSCPGDGLSCTSTTCDGEGDCNVSIKTGWCNVEGKCVKAGSAHPQNPQCQECNPSKSKTDWSNVQEGKTCNDGSDCTNNDKCTAGSCSGTSLECNQAMECQKTKCIAVPNSNNICDYSELKAGWCLIGGQCFFGGISKPGDPCLTCNPGLSTTSWSNVANGTTLCNDGNVCSQKDECVDGKCTGLNFNDCDDGESCTSDACHAQKGCQYINLTTKCADDGNSCTQDVCNAGVCSHPPLSNGTTCDDDNGCTKNDMCDGSGKCTGSKMVSADCDDNNACTFDYCSGTTGCEHAAQPLNGNSCDDGKPCTQNDQCQSGQCKGQAYTCLDGCETCDGSGGCDIDENKCSIDGSCFEDGQVDPNQSCRECNATANKSDWSIDNTNTCTDGNACTTDACVAGSCKGTSYGCKECEVCDGLGGCTLKAGHCLIDGVCYSNGTKDINTCQECNALKDPKGWTANDANTCTDGNACTVDTCVQGACSSQSYTCDVCTKCDGTGQCVADALVDGQSCDDDISCTENDVCASGVCTGAIESNKCLVDGTCYSLGAQGNKYCERCQPGTSQTQFTLVALGTTCTSDNDECTVDACDANGDCVHTKKNAGESCGNCLICDNSGQCGEDPGCGGTVVLKPVADASMFSNGKANGAGDLWTGLNKQQSISYRALLRFDLSGIPANATIDNAVLELFVSKVPGGAVQDQLSLHRLTKAWSEGVTDVGKGKGSSPAVGDVTWTYATYNTDAWTAAGGDFVSQASDSSSAKSTDVSFKSELMSKDITDWVGNAATNYGWIVKGEETKNLTAKRWGSRNHSTKSPTLTITYSVPD